MYGGWKGRFQVGDLVRYVGPDRGMRDPIQGQLGRLITPGELGDPPPSWVVDFSTTSGVFPAANLAPFDQGPPLQVSIREATDEDTVLVQRLLGVFGSTQVARLGQLVEAGRHPALLAEGEDGSSAGVLTYVVGGDRCEVLTLHVSDRRRGVGTALLAEVERIAAAAGCRALWLITTNDNVDALRFYQRRGFRIVAVHPGAVDRSRETLKPEVPEVGEYGIPLRDEIELEKDL
jgi:ribosomal protein S18 acetylase RimI-like enzyme